MCNRNGRIQLGQVIVSAAEDPEFAGFSDLGPGSCIIWPPEFPVDIILNFTTTRASNGYKSTAP
jgi:hypothetical protein